MQSFLFLSLLASCATALWPAPSNSALGDKTLFISKSVPFYIYEADDKRVRSDLSFLDILSPVQQFFFAANSNTDSPPPEQNPKDNDDGGWKLRKRVDEGSIAADDSSDRWGGGNGKSRSVTSPEIIEYAINTAWRRIFKYNLYPWMFHPRDWTPPSPEKKSKWIQRVNLKLHAQDPANIGKPLVGEIDESYSLYITEAGVATITSNSSIGIAHALSTFSQLFYTDQSERTVYTPYIPVNIYDTPAFVHRGINMDVARNFFPVSIIKKQIDAAAFNKMNRFHLHVTDSQSWPLDIPSMPELSAKGAYHREQVYTASDFAELQRHAALQGVEMVTEIDMPGHTSSIWHSHPDLIAAFNIQPNWDTYAAEPPSGTLKLNSSDVYDFLEKLFDDLLPRVYPYTNYFHTGGDEVNKNAYTLDDTVRSASYDVLQPLMQRFIDRNHDQVRAAGLTPVVWEEMLIDWNLTLGHDVIVQAWQSDEAVAKITRSGHRAIAGNYNYWYLDCGKGQWLNFDPSVAAQFWPFNDYCAPCKFAVTECC